MKNFIESAENYFFINSVLMNNFLVG